MEQITGQVVYVGPMIPDVGLQRGKIFRNGIQPHLYPLITECPALWGLFVPMTAQAYGAARKELNFDIARNMRSASRRNASASMRTTFSPIWFMGTQMVAEA